MNKTEAIKHLETNPGASVGLVLAEGPGPLGGKMRFLGVVFRKGPDLVTPKLEPAPEGGEYYELEN